MCNSNSVKPAIAISFKSEAVEVTRSEIELLLSVLPELMATMSAEMSQLNVSEDVFNK